MAVHGSIHEDQERMVLEETEKMESARPAVDDLGPGGDLLPGGQAAGGEDADALIAHQDIAEAQDQGPARADRFGHFTSIPFR